LAVNTPFPVYLTWWVHRSSFFCVYSADCVRFCWCCWQQILSRGAAHVRCVYATSGSRHMASLLVHSRTPFLLLVPQNNLINH